METQKKGFRERLTERQETVKSLVCVGLDPVLSKMPMDFVMEGGPVAPKVKEWMLEIAMATAPFACMFKPNLAHWEAVHGGMEALREVIFTIHSRFPDIVVFADAKRGDIARTQQHYGKAIFEYLGADGMNFSPYMGIDCMEALVDKNHPERALVGLCYTSNPSARQIQSARMLDNRQFWEFIAELTLEWAESLGVVENAGLVMAAAYVYDECAIGISSLHLVRGRKIVGDKLWFLIPGIGTQGGFIEETVKASYRGPGSIAINSSSEIIFASEGEDYAEAAAKKAEELRDKINAAL